MKEDPIAFLRRLYHAGVSAARPGECLKAHWPPPAKGRTGIIACGKAAVSMAQLAAGHYGPATAGLVIYPENEPVPPGAPGQLRWLPSSHPAPDRRSVEAALAALDFAASMGEDDLLLVLTSGGGSSLMCLPAAGVTLEEKQDLGRQLLDSGATISEINCVRKHVSRVKGGRLAAACRAPVITLAVSDVPGDAPSIIASGPTVQSEDSRAQARAVIERYRLRPAPSITAALDDPENDCPRFDPAGPTREFRIVASGASALAAAARLCQEQGIETVLLGDDLQGEARELGEQHARAALAIAESGQCCCILSGGETTVTVSQKPGRGGRNSEYALALALTLDAHPAIWALAADTDGIDGYGGHAGATVDPKTLKRARLQNLDAAEALARNDSASFFEQVGGLIVEGPTGTNVNDFRAVLVHP
ncbi:MAG: glycerate kinase type-2 family protein [Lysobacterales bacterium]